MYGCQYARGRLMTSIRATLVGAAPRNTYTPETPDYSRAACIGHDPELWFPDPTDVLGTSEAVEICHNCPVKQACLAHAMREEPAGGRHGIRGGLTPEERRKLSGGTKACPDCGRFLTATQMRRHPELCASTRETIRLYQQGTPWAEIARIQGLHHTTVNARIHHWRAER